MWQSMGCAVGGGAAAGRGAAWHASTASPPPTPPPHPQDHVINAANWQWLSASAFFNQYYRVYSPVTFGKKYDPQGNFIKKFLPQARGLGAQTGRADWARARLACSPPVPVTRWLQLAIPAHVSPRSPLPSHHPTPPYPTPSHPQPALPTPQLAQYPSKYIYEPWTAPLEVRRARHRPRWERRAPPLYWSAAGAPLGCACP